MRDDYLSNEWASERHHLARAINAAVQRFATGFARLQHRRFEAPWRTDPRRSPQNAC